ncbi:VOC family protein, partial [Enterococcus faecalis]
LWKNLTTDGQILMAFGVYPVSPLYGWVVDKFGVSSQVSFSGKEQTIVPTFMFANEKYGEPAKALSQWLAIFGPGEII